MLNNLTIKNFGLIDHLTLEFSKGLNVLTGETGAGKSILIDALRCALGERIDSSFIRNPSLPLHIEAVFEITDPALLNNEIIAEYLTDQNSELIFIRTLTHDGKSKNKINGTTVTAGQLRTLGNCLMDFHGPHDHQLLLNEQFHLHLLDQMINFNDLKTKYSNSFSQYSKVLDQIKQLNNASLVNEREQDFLAHQVKELESISLSEETYEKIHQEQIKLNNSEKLHEHISATLNIFNNEDIGINTQVRKSYSTLKSLVTIDNRAKDFIEQITALQELSTDLTSNLEDYIQSLEFDPQTAQKINEQCDIYYEIKRKYGPTLQQAQRLLQESKSKLDLIKNFENNDKILKDELETLKKSLTEIASKITKLRLKSSLELKKTIEKELKELGINNVQFEARIDSCEFNLSGQDTVVFYISPNAGEELKPLAQIVSSGEAARVMLALKKALINVDPIPVLIFDEIDAQIGGRLGTITGKKLKEISKKRQVILITHLPQIASFADCHYKVIKTVKSSRAITEVSMLTEKERIQEIAQMMSGQETGKIALSHAQEMLEAAQRIR